MTIDEIRKLSDKDLASKVTELKGALLALRFQARAGQLDNGSKITVTRKDIAKCMTVQNERKKAAAVNAAKAK
ncbi:MAG: 50S ribosomal protein L29 [Bacilli bacterium]|jgi:large subunit ribosomal protein L29|nr:50S ribosomal protein L29 [Bacilli bacterium]